MSDLADALVHLRAWMRQHQEVYAGDPLEEGVNLVARKVIEWCDQQLPPDSVARSEGMVDA